MRAARECRLPTPLRHALWGEVVPRHGRCWRLPRTTRRPRRRLLHRGDMAEPAGIETLIGAVLGEGQQRPIDRLAVGTVQRQGNAVGLLREDGPDCLHPPLPRRGGVGQEDRGIVDHRLDVALLQEEIGLVNGRDRLMGQTPLRQILRRRTALDRDQALAGEVLDAG